MELTDLTVAELAQGYRAKEFSAVDATQAFLNKIEKENPKLNAFLEVFDDAIDSAKKADEMIATGNAHALAGIPIATKDNILIEGKIASAASKMLETHVATYDATAVKKLKETGAIFIGRTNMDEFAMGSSTEHSAFGVTHNPHDLDRVPGGSSGGSAAAVAAHLAPVALGSETCGSIRQPSSLCGLIGLKPTYGAVSRSGLIAMGSSLDQIGPFARTVADAELVFNAIRGRDPLDATTLPDYEPVGAKSKKIGVPRAFVDQASERAKGLFEKSLTTLRGQGYEVVDIDFPSAPYALPAYYIVMPAEVSTNLARLDGARYGHHAEGATLMEDYKKSRAEGFGPETRRRIILGTYVLSSGYYDAYYTKATALRTLLARDLDAAFSKVSYIATPTAPDTAFKIGEKSDPVSMYLEDVFSAPANLTGVPSISVPAGLAERDGKTLPIGIQFMSPKRTEAALFAVARDLLGEK
jgi:aspartyl-tRNA(Asn)/glutamyl-tRNA(Gln) amidotransferase subunit A